MLKVAIFIALPSASFRGLSERVSARLHEFQRHTIALADGVVFGVIEVRIRRLTIRSTAPCRGQGPYTEGMILRVFWIRIDLGCGRQFEPGILRELHDNRR